MKDYQYGQQQENFKDGLVYYFSHALSIFLRLLLTGVKALLTALFSALKTLLHLR